MSNIRELILQFTPAFRVNKTIVTLENASGYYAADDVKAGHNFPSYDISAVTGFAMRADDLTQLPTTLKIINYSVHVDLPEYSLNNGEAAYIMANQRLPKNANIVYEYNNVTKEGRQITITKPSIIGYNVKFAGIDFEEDETVIHAGEKLDTVNLLAASLLQVPFVSVYERLRIGVIFNCNEIVSDYNEHLNQNDIINSLYNAFSSSLFNIGCRALNLGKVMPLEAQPKHILEFKHILNQALDNIQILVSVGGFYKANENLLWATLAHKGFEYETCKINIGGVHQVMIGRCNDIVVIALPTDLVVSVILANVLLKLIIEKMMNIELIPKRFARLNRSLDNFDLESDYIYAKLEGLDKGELIVSPYSVQDSLMISRLKYTDYLVTIDKEKPQQKGDLVEIIALK